MPRRLEPADLKSLRGFASAAWIGCVSFEPRCTASAELVASLGHTVAASLLLTYPTTAEPVQKDGSRRRRHEKEILGSLTAAGAKEATMRSVHPYRLGELRAALRDVEHAIHSSQPDAVIVDLTCITKMHVLVTAEWLEALENSGEIFCVYTTPAEYAQATIRELTGGEWVDTILAPLRLEPHLYHDSASGIVILGHEGSRTRLALAQQECVEALIVLAGNGPTDDVERVARLANATLLNQIKRGERVGWTELYIPRLDVSTLYDRIRSFAERTWKSKRRLVMFPFGPKILVAQAGLAVGGGHARPWICYPVPRQYNVDYTIGIGDIGLFRLVK